MKTMLLLSLLFAPAGLAPAAAQTAPDEFAGEALRCRLVSAVETVRVGNSLFGSPAFAWTGPDRLVGVWQDPERHLVCGVSEDANATWRSERVGQKAEAASWVDLASVGGGVLFLAHHDGKNRVLGFARSLSGGEDWEHFTAVAPKGVIMPPSSLAAADAGNVFISYGDGSRDALMVARSENGGEDWTSVVVDPEASAGVGTWSSLVALDAERLCVAYQDFSSRHLRFARSMDGGRSWTSETIDASGTVGAFASLRALPSGELLIAYRDFSAGRLRLARSEDGGAHWSISTLVVADRAPACSALALGGDGSLWLCYADPGSARLLLAASFDGGHSWQHRLVAVSVDLSRGISLCASPSGDPLLTYCERGSAMLMAMRLRLDRRWGLGVETPAEPLHVAGAARLDASGGERFLLLDPGQGHISTAGGQTLFLQEGAVSLLADGRVGIGTVEPGAQLGISSGVRDRALLELRQEEPGAAVRLRLDNTVSAPESSWSLIARPDGRFSLTHGSGRSVLTLDGEGHVGVGTADPSRVLTVARNAPTQPIADAWTTYSSARWKTDVAPIADPLAGIEALRGVRFRWKDSGRDDLGLIAEEVARVFPELVSAGPEGDASAVDYGRLAAVLLEGIKAQSARIEALEARVAELEQTRAAAAE